MRKLSETAYRRFVVNAVLVLAILFVAAVGFLPASSVPLSGAGGTEPVRRGNAARSSVSLMFNVYGGTEEVEGILDVLAEKGAKCTFFLGGCWADDNEPLLRRMAEEGHEIASHGYFHRDHKKLDASSNREEIEAAEKVIAALSGVRPTLFAPPSGSYGTATLEVCAEMGYRVVLWSKDTIDWRDKDEDLVFRRATKELQNGDLVLMHPTPHTLRALPRVLDEIEAQGFTEVTVSENLRD